MCAEYWSQMVPDEKPDGSRPAHYAEAVIFQRTFYFSKK
jgi:hypothetical protein